jgi:hypothetical protein
MKRELQSYISGLEKETINISHHRKEKLRELSEFIGEKLRNNETVSLIFICTHNSRRSHLCQVWTAVLADFFGLEGIETYSGGTEVTAFNPRAVDALRRAGFKIEDPGGENPHYLVNYDDQKEPLICFSKTFGDKSNPDNNFAAVMTCTDADEGCPFVPGASYRISIPYVDPKESDGTTREAETYDKRSLQIASEMYFMLSLVA